MLTLTPPQQKIIAHQQGHARVVAVAGAGKTTTLTHFIAARLSDGAQPRRMLVLMYNRSAKEDFERKLQRLLPNTPVPEVRTFHSLGYKIYQRLVHEGHLPAQQGKLLGDKEAEVVLWRLLQHLADAETKQDILAQRKKWVEPALSFVERVKSGLEPPEVVFSQLNLPPPCRLFIPMFHQFEQWRKKEGRLSFADMLYEPVKFLTEHPQVAATFGGHMQWILVDEYQDINAIQQQLLTLLYAGQGYVMVIGDPDQTIYEFRGSKPDYLVRGFNEQMGQVQTYHLPHSFRYGHALALTANHLIRHNQARDDILCLAHPSTPHTQVFKHEVFSEANFALSLIKQQAEKRPLHDIAVICRIWALAAPLELGLLAAGIPYQMPHSSSVLERSELRIFWFLFALAAGQVPQYSAQNRYELWLLLLSTPYPKIKQDVLKNLAQQLATATDHFSDVLLEHVPSDLNSWQKRSLETRAEILADIEHISLTAHALANQYVQQTELYKGLTDNAFSAQQADDQIQTIQAFLSFLQTTPMSAAEAYDYLLGLKKQRQQQHSEEQAQGVQLISVHKSKGLEWPVVILPGVNAHYYPYNPEGEFSQLSDDESERRLLYVAFTRAQDELHVLVPRPATKSGKALEFPSRFQAEACLEHSQSIGRALYERAQTVEMNPVQGAVAPWLPRYLTEIGQTLDIKLPNVLVAKAKQWLTQSSGRAQKHAPERQQKHGAARVLYYVQHQTLGQGAVMYEDDRYLKIAFEQDPDARTFNKHAVEPLLRRL